VYAQTKLMSDLKKTLAFGIDMYDNSKMHLSINSKIKVYWILFYWKLKFG